MNESIGKIADESPAFRAKKYDVGLLDGKAGLALFYAYLYRRTGDQRHYDLYSCLLDECFTGMGRGNAMVIGTFVAGITGIGWLVRHLVSIELLDESSLGSLDVIETYILKALEQDRENNNFQFYTGLAGKGLYFLEGPITETGYKSIGIILSSLQAGAINQDRGIAWLTKSLATDDIYYDMGIPHGIPGIILFLCKVCKAGIHRDLALDLLAGAVEWLLSKEQHSGLGYFPHIIGREFTGRLAWCYGDLGIAAALLEASEVLMSQDLKEKALSIFDKEASRDIQSAMVFKSDRFNIYDRGLCHGTSGIALFFNSIYKKTGKDNLKMAADYWTDFTLSIKTTSKQRGIGGLIFPVPLPKDSWRKRPYVLEGSAGVGLSYLSLLENEQLPWERIFMLR